MDTSTASAIALVLCIGLWIPYFMMEIRRGKARGHTGSHGGSQGVTPTLARTLADQD